MYLRLWFAVAGILTTMTGCPGDPAIVESGDDDETGAAEADGGTEPTTGTEQPLTELPLAEFFVRAEDAVCAWQVGCNAFGGPGRCKAVVHFEDRLSIYAMVGVGSNESITPEYVAAAVEIGRVLYDEAAAVTCLNYVATQTCEYAAYHVPSEAELAGKAACEQVFTGTMNKNGPCTTAIECAGPAVCGFNPMCMDMCCAGACRFLAEPIALGEPCGVNPQASCVDGAYCGVDLTCEVLPLEGDSCGISYQCGDGSACQYINDDYECVPPKQVGQACEYYGDCQAGLTCVRDENFEGTCVAPADQGEACVLGFDNDPTCKRLDNYCDPATLTCTLLPGNGESCEYAGCRGDFFCAQAAGYRCSPVADEGEPCGYNGNEGVPCSGDSQCRYNPEDETQKCVAPAPTQCPPPVDPLEG